MTVSRALRRARRDQAFLVVERLKPEIHKTRINDAQASHITLWLQEGRRLEWWPSTERWRDWRGKAHFGNPLQLVRFIRADLALAKEGKHEFS